MVYGLSQQEPAWAAQAVDDTAATQINTPVTIPVLANDLDSLDLVFANDGQNRVCLGNGSGTFTCSAVSADIANSGKGALGDLNANGILDVVFANRYGQPNRVCLGDGAGGFTSCSDVSPDINDSYRCALGDFNGDGNLDVVFANSNQPNTVCLGDGLGGFTSCTDINSDGAGSRDVDVADLTGDGNLDLVFANYGQPNRVCWGDGSGGFDCDDVSPNGDDTSGVALGDLDGDGIMDAVFSNVAQTNRVCLGDGLGGFTSCGDVSADTHVTTRVALGDVNADGHLDIVFANFDQRDQVCLGNGAGGFICSGVNADTAKSLPVVLGDFNGDGNLDAVFGTDRQPNRICLADGTGAFTSCSDVSSDLERSQGVTAGFLGLDTSTLTVTVLPANGAAVVSLDGTITYTPDSGFEGTDNFTYGVEGSTAVVTIEVTPTPSQPQGADLEVTVTHPRAVTIEQHLSFTITVVNKGPNATLADLVKHLGGAAQLVSAAPSQGSCAQALSIRNTLPCDLGELNPGATATILVVVRPTRAGKVSSRVEVQGKLADPFPQDNSASQEVEAVTFLVAPRSLHDQHPLLADTYVGLGVVNTLGQQTEVEVSAHSEGGEEIDRGVLSALPARGQAALLTSEISVKEGVTLISHGRPSPVQGFFMVGDAAERRLDGVAGLQEADTLYFPVVRNTGTEKTILFVFHSGQQPGSSVALRLFSPEGVLVEEVLTSLAPKGALIGSVEEIFGDVGTVEEAYVQVEASVDRLTGFVVNVSAEHISSLIAQPRAFTPRMLVPHFFVDGLGGGTTIRLLNVGSARAEVTLRAFDDEANPVGSAQFQIEKEKLFVGDLRQLLGLDTSALPPSGVLSGYLELEAKGGLLGPVVTTARLVGAVTFTGNQGRFQSTVPMIPRGLTRALLAQVAQSAEWNIFTGLAILNGGSRPATVTIRAYHQDGSLTAEKSLTVGGKSRQVGLLNEDRFFGAAFEQIAGHLEIESDKPVAILGLFGDFNSEFLSAIATQRVPR